MSDLATAARKLLDDGLSEAAAARQLGVSRQKLRRAVGKDGGSRAEQPRTPTSAPPPSPEPPAAPSPAEAEVRSLAQAPGEELRRFVREALAGGAARLAQLLELTDGLLLTDLQRGGARADALRNLGVLRGVLQDKLVAAAETVRRLDEQAEPEVDWEADTSLPPSAEALPANVIPLKAHAS